MGSFMLVEASLLRTERKSFAAWGSTPQLPAKVKQHRCDVSVAVAPLLVRQLVRVQLFVRHPYVV
jgi:hypothetical protein